MNKSCYVQRLVRLLGLVLFGWLVIALWRASDEGVAAARTAHDATSQRNNTVGDQQWQRTGQNTDRKQVPEEVLQLALQPSGVAADELFSPRMAPQNRQVVWPPSWVQQVHQEVEMANRNSSLTLLIEVCRHGARVPLSTYPRDPLPYRKWPEGIGQLTSIGVRQQIDFGRIVRHIYGGFIPENYHVMDVHVRSSDIDRALMSASSQLVGLFMDFATEAIFQYQPVPIHTVSTDVDTVMLPGTNCPRWQELQTIMRQSDVWKKRESEHQLFLDHLGRVIMGLGRPANMDDVATVYDVWECDTAQGIQLPPQVNHSVREQVDVLYGLSFADLYRSAEAANLTGGPLALQILNIMRTKVAGLRTEKYILFSGHDTTLMALLSVLQIHPNRAPPFNSTVIFELRQRFTSLRTPIEQSDPTVIKSSSAKHPRMPYWWHWLPTLQRYREQEQHAPPLANWFVVVRYNWQAIHIPGCQVECPLERFIQLVEPRSMSASSKAVRAAACQPLVYGWLNAVEAPHYLAVDAARRKWGVVFILGILCGVLILLGCVVVFWLGWRFGKKRELQNHYHPVFVQPLTWESARMRSVSEITPTPVRNI
jgi:hypothetical protein